MIKVISFVIVFLFPILAFSEEAYYLKDNSECEVKVWKNNNLVKIPNKYVSGIPLMPIQMKRNPSMGAFKIDGQLYVTEMKCFQLEEAQSLNEDKSSSPSNQKNYDSVDKRIYDFNNFQDNNNFFQLEVGTASVSNQEQVVPDYTVFNDVNGVSSFEAKAEGSKYKVQSSFGFTYGNKFSENSFWLIKVRRLSGVKTDIVQVVDAGQSGTIDFDYFDTLMNFYVGAKFLFLKYSSFKPSISILAGLSSLNGKIKVAENEFLKYSALDLAGSAEIGGEYFFNTHFSIGTYFGYEYLGQKKIKALGDGGNLTNDSWKSGLNYSNVYGNLGLAYYFK